jgi:hypothetical protein
MVASQQVQSGFSTKLQGPIGLLKELKTGVTTPSWKLYKTLIGTFLVIIGRSLHGIAQLKSRKTF